MQIWVMLRMAYSHSSIHALFMPYFPTVALSCTCTHNSHSALPWLCVSLLHNNKMTNLLFSSIYPPHPLAGLSQASGTHIGSGVEPFYPIIHLCFTVSESAGSAQHHTQNKRVSHKEPEKFIHACVRTHTYTHTRAEREQSHTMNLLQPITLGRLCCWHLNTKWEILITSTCQFYGSRTDFYMATEYLQSFQCWEKNKVVKVKHIVNYVNI